MEKQTPFIPDQENLTAGVGRCKCGAEFLDKSTNYCGNCGQKLDWGDGKDCQSCSWNNLEVFGTGICELPINLEVFGTGICKLPIIEDYIRS